MPEVLVSTKPLYTGEVIYPSPLVCEVINYFESRQAAFTEELMRFGRKWGHGFDKRRKEPYSGEYTGVGLCAIASGIMEKGGKNKFPQGLEIESYFLHTRFLDPQTHLKPTDKPFPHHLVRFKDTDQNQWYIADPTFRQLLITVDPDKMLIGLQFEAAMGIYGADEIYHQMQLKNPAKAFKYEPRTIKKGYTHSQHQMLIDARDRYFKGVTLKDYQRLGSVFLD